ncbi:MAG: hypothetical protein KF718_10050 [Polyangiaceae bacterium]|nr:hypothetical protein [Polyangiaceae bacterium]
MKTPTKVTPRRPSGAARAFVAGAPSKPEPGEEREPVKKAKKVAASRRGNVRERGRTGEVVAQMTVYLPPELEKQLRIEAVTREMRPSDLIAAALKEFFKNS